MEMIMKKLFFLLLLPIPVSLFCAESKLCRRGKPPATAPGFGTTLSAEDFEEFQAFREFARQQELKREEERQRNTHPPHRTRTFAESFATGRVADPVTQPYKKTHRRDRSISDGVLAEMAAEALRIREMEREREEAEPPEYHLINTSTVDDILEYGEKELREALAAFTALTEKMRNDLTAATIDYRKQTETSLTPYVHKEKTGLRRFAAGAVRVVTRRRKTHEEEAALKRQVKENTKDVAAAKAALVPLLVRIGVTSRQVKKMGEEVEIAMVRVGEKQRKLTERRMSISSSGWSPVRSRRVAPAGSVRRSSTLSGNTQDEENV